MRITFITGGAPHYEAGLIAGLVEHNVAVDVIGGDDLAGAPVLQHPQVRFRNFYGKSERGTAWWRKVLRLVTVYLKLLTHAVTSDARLVHIQWPYKLAFLDRTALNLYYKLLGKKLVFTAHNIDAAARDGKQSWANRFSLRFNYHIMDRIIVHTERMKGELVSDYGVNSSRISVIPHGIMSAVPSTGMDREQARQRLGLNAARRVLLCFGLITPYKGIEYLVAALGRLCKGNEDYVLVIAGRVKECPEYWDRVCQSIRDLKLEKNVVICLGHVPDESVEMYFKAADVIVMPYRSIFQSGVLFLAYRFGLPVIATDVGSLREDIVEGMTGLMCKVDDSEDMAKVINTYFESELFRDLENSRRRIFDFASARYSWSSIGEQTRKVYGQAMGR